MKMIEMNKEDFETFRELSVFEYASKLAIDTGLSNEQHLNVKKNLFINSD